MMDMKRAEKVANKGSRARDPVHFKLFEWRREACVRAHSPIPICLSLSLSLSLLSFPFVDGENPIRAHVCCVHF